MYRLILLLLITAASAWAQCTLVFNPFTGRMECGGSGGSGTTETASNVGGAVEVFKQKTVNDLEFRTVEAAAGADVTQNTSTVSVGADDTRQVRYRTAAGAVSGTASPGLDIGVDTTNDRFYFAYDTDLWAYLLTSGTVNASSDISAGTLPAVRGGLGADASAFSGVVKMVSGTASVVSGTASDCVKVDGTSGSCGGSAASGEYSGTINFASIPDMSCRDATITATGAATGSVVGVGAPSGLDTGILLTAWVSSADVITFRACNFSGAAVDPASATYSAKITTGDITGSGTIDFAAIPDMSCASATFTANGAATGRPVIPGWPSALETGLHGTMFVSAANTITARLCNFSGASVNPASGTFSAVVGYGTYFGYGVKTSIVSKTANYTLTTGDHTVLCDTTGGTVTLTLPAAASPNAGVQFVVKKIAAANTCTIDGNAAETIDGAATLDITTNNQSYTIISDGTNWRVI